MLRGTLECNDHFFDSFHTRNLHPFRSFQIIFADILDSRAQSWTEKSTFYSRSVPDHVISNNRVIQMIIQLTVPRIRLIHLIIREMRATTISID